mgnify:FL=1|jgi:chemotaxis-related protein WspB|tara:strand:- start:14419 stop:14877 length:459 start_codon:yes stop_codon:yes gene_type:complete
MLIVVFKLGDQDYGVDASNLIAVVPGLPLRIIPGVVQGIAGLLHYQRQYVPVVDLKLLTTGLSCEPKLSTRIILAKYPDESIDAIIGLRVEDAIDTLWVENAEIQKTHVTTPSARYLGKLIVSGDRTVQVIGIGALLPSEVIDSLYQGSAES